MNPTVNIKFNKFLEPIFVAYVNTLPKPEGWTFPIQEEVDKNIEMYKEAWAEIGDKILTAMQKITGLSYTRNLIDVHIVSINPRPFSSPIVMKSRYSKEDFIYNLTEELIHVLSSDNKEAWRKVRDGVVTKYKNEPRTVKNHIIVFVVMQEIGKQTGIKFEIQRMESDINREYDRAESIAKADKEFVINLFK